jgi:hypothetical protein
LRKNRVSANDIQSLDAAIQKDLNAASHQYKKYGPAVKSWLQMMLSKAVDASWQIELGTASSLLATALNS